MTITLRALHIKGLDATQCRTKVGKKEIRV